MKASDVILTEPIEGRGGLRGTVRVWLTNSGRCIAEYKLGSVKWQVPTSGATAPEAMRNAKKWLTTSIGMR